MEGLITLTHSRGLLANWTLSELVVEDFFGYTPSTALAATALALFALAAIVIAVQTWRSGWRYMHTVTVTGLIEAAGYAALLVCIKQSGSSNIYGAYVTMQVFVILSPNLLQAMDYWTVGNLLAASPELTRGRRLLGRKAITAIFAGGDLFALAVQAIGISIWATAKSSPDGSADQVKLGSIIMLVGLAIQLLGFVLFTLLAAWVHRHPKNAIAGTRNLRRLYQGLYLNVAFLYVRNIFRFVEFTQSTILPYPPAPGTYVLADQQVLFYTLDTLPILLCFLAIILFHPGWFLPSLDAPALPAAAAAAAGRNGGSQKQRQLLDASEAGSLELEEGKGSKSLGAPRPARRASR